jgi:hypothetical protein
LASSHKALSDADHLDTADSELHDRAGIRQHDQLARQGRITSKRQLMSAIIEAKRHAQAAHGTNDPNEKLDEIANAIEQLVKAIEEIQKSLRG